MNITLSQGQRRLIEEQLSQGHYQSADEVVTKALQLLAKQQEYLDWVADVRTKTDEAAAELARGEGIPLDTFIAKIHAKFQQG